MSKKKKIIAVISGVLMTYIIGVYFVLSAVLTSILPGKLSELLKRQVEIEHIWINPVTLSVDVRGFSLKEADGKNLFVRFEWLYVNAEILSVLKKGLIIKKLSLEKPEINIERLEDTTFNFSDLSNYGGKAPEPAENEESAAKNTFLFAVSDISIEDGSVVYNDIPFGKKHTIEPINWKLPFISNFTRHRDLYSEPALTFSVDGAAVSVDVKSKLFKNSIETIVTLSVKNLSIPQYMAYAPSDIVRFKVEKGSLDIQTEVSFRKEDDSNIVETKGELTFSDFDVKDMEENGVFSIEQLKVGLLPSVVTENNLHFGEILLDRPVISAVRKADGTINLANLVAEKKTADPAPEKENKENEETPGKPFRLDIDRFLLTDGTAGFNDFAIISGMAGDTEKGSVTTVNDINISINSFSTAPDKKTGFSIKTNINKAAPLSIDGEMTLAPFSAETDIALSDVALSWFQPYLPENVQLIVTGGKAGVSAHVSLSKQENEKLSAKITGNTAVQNFASVDREKTESFLKWTSFTIDGVDVSVWPLKVSVDKIAFNGLENQLMVFEDGVSNLDKIFVKQPAETGEKKETEPAGETSEVTPVRVGEFSMKQSKFSFMDRSLKPHYSNYLALNNLSVKGLTSENFKAADVVADGSVDGAAPLSITGKINPLSKDLFVDLDFKVDHVEMVPFSTYTGKYIGRKIEKGKFNVEVKYHIREKEIQAENHVLIDQFTLGKTVESPDVLNLPVGLAVSLLKDRKGIININMPISGRTDDPDFKWGKVVLKAFGNLIMKAATSPFALVGSLVGGGEEMRFIEFTPGSTLLDETGEKKLSGIRTLLTERPALKMEVVGYVDAENDRKALANLELERKIKARELVEAVRNNQIADAQTLASIEILPEQREKMLRKLYKKEVLEGPAEGASVKELNDPTLTNEEMERLLLERIVINDAELQLLAMERAGKVKNRLLQDEAVSADRVFLKEPDSPFGKKLENFQPSRVELDVN